MLGGLLRDRPKLGTGWHKLWEYGRVHSHSGPFPTPALAPLQALVVEWYVAYLAAYRIHKSSRKFVAEVTAQEEKLIGLTPHIGLACADPVRFGFGNDISYYFSQAHGRKCEAPRTAQPAKIFCATAVEPEYGRPKRPSLLVHIHDRSALRRQNHACNSFFTNTLHSPQLLASLAHALPEVLRIFLGPARLFAGTRANQHASLG